MPRNCSVPTGLQAGSLILPCVSRVQRNAQHTTHRASLQSQLSVKNEALTLVTLLTLAALTQQPEWRRASSRSPTCVCPSSNTYQFIHL
jgi:hypothetical protein